MTDREKHSRTPWKNIAAGSIGNAFEFYDFMIYTFFAIQIGKTFFPVADTYGSLMLSLATFGVGFLSRPLGGIVIGLFSDRAGRRAAMMISYVMMGGSTLVMALIPTYAQIGIAAPVLVVVARLVQGFSVGGAVGPNAAFLMESAPVARRGFIVSFQAASQFVATTFGGAVGLILSLLLTAEELSQFGWRIAFLIGSLALPFGIWLQHGITETLQTAPAAKPSGEPEAMDASELRPIRSNLRIVVLGFIAQSVGPIVAYVFAYFATFAQHSLEILPQLTFAIATVGNIASACAVLLGGWLSDRYGRRPVMFWANLFNLVLVYPTFLWMVTSRTAASMLVYLAVQSIGMMPWGVLTTTLTESLPARVRSSTFSIIYASSVALFGGTCQMVITWLIHATGSLMAPAWYLIAALICSQIAFFFFHESAPVRNPPVARRDGEPASATIL